MIGVVSAGTLHPALLPFPRVGLGQSAPLGLTRKGQDIVCRVIDADLGKVHVSARPVLPTPPLSVEPIRARKPSVKLRHHGCQFLRAHVTRRDVQGRFMRKCLLGHTKPGFGCLRWMSPTWPGLERSRWRPQRAKQRHADQCQTEVGCGVDGNMMSDRLPPVTRSLPNR